jgi:hypothetical protein
MLHAVHRQAIKYLPIIGSTRQASHDARSTLKARTVVHPRPQPSVTNEEGTQTLRLRQHGNKSLPLPPLMDPIAIEARERYKQPKPNPKPMEMTDFQKELASNPYGKKLTKQLQYTSITNTREPQRWH